MLLPNVKHKTDPVFSTPKILCPRTVEWLIFTDLTFFYYNDNYELRNWNLYMNFDWYLKGSTGHILARRPQVGHSCSKASWLAEQQLREPAPSVFMASAEWRRLPATHPHRCLSFHQVPDALIHSRVEWVSTSGRNNWKVLSQPRFEPALYD